MTFGDVGYEIEPFLYRSDVAERMIWYRGTGARLGHE